jgi:uncharacterized protein (DUF362 family)
MTPEMAADRRRMMIRLLQLGGMSGASAATGLWLSSRNTKPGETGSAIVKTNFGVPPDPGRPELAVIQGEDPRLLVRRALEELGGARRFVSRGDVVVVKPNASWDRTPEQAANTNPLVVAETVRQCLDAGARKVIVTDVTINEPHRCFERSGIGEAARAEGAEVVLPGDRGFKEVDLRGEVLGSWPVLEPFLNADKMINLPIAKHHSLTGATIGMKNWYGILGGPRHRLHQRIHESLADLAGFIRPTLTIVDAYRVLTRNGPSGGSLGDVALKKTVIAGTDPVALDAWVAKAYWNLDWQTLRYLKLASDRHLGNLNFESVRTAVATV